MTADLNAWIARHEEAMDHLDPARTRALLAALERPADVAEGDPLPPLFHWLHFWDVRPPSDTGPDGHRKRGGFLPPIDLPRRMWAGGEVTFVAPLRLGEAVRKVSTITAIEEKTGRSGVLVFVTVTHEISGPSGLAIRERQDLVFREPPPRPPPVPAAPTAGPMEPSDWREPTDAGPILLFRYSALTMNSHRIHYDRPYAVEEEGYEGLVVHGPLQATLLAGLAARELPKPLARFDYRGLSAATDTAPIDVCGRRDDAGLELWVEQGGVRTMAARGVSR
jgi:3-methylfumaryl-CoA hydratase